jgi:hypothetical protein
MGKLGINVGEDFPAEEVAPPERAPGDDTCRDREEWLAKARAFKEDVRRAAQKHFGEHSFTAHHAFMLRIVLAVALAALALSVVPHVLLLALAVLGIGLFMARHGHFHHHDYYETPRGDI